MACIVYHTDKKSGSTYAFRSESYRDPVTRKPRNRREYLGRVDPETGEIVPKRPRGPRADRAHAADAGADPAARLAEALARVGELEVEVSALRSERDSLRRALASVRTGMQSLAEGVEAALG